MSKPQINTKSSTYIKDKEAFLKRKKQFNESKGIPFKIPSVNCIDIDLYLFYTLVQQRGGISKVNFYDVWESFLRPLRLPHPCINGSTLLRRIYGTYLEKYEKAKGPPSRDDDNDMDDLDLRSTRGRGSNVPRTPYGGGTYYSASGEPLRAVQTRVAGPSERLALSLLSPMPNEQDFAVNVCTVLAADHSNRMPLGTTPHILDFLLAHAGVYNHMSLRDTIGRSYFEARGRYPHEFWQLRAGGGGAKELADETKFSQLSGDQPELMVQALAAHNTLTDCLLNECGGEELIEKILEEEANEDWVTEPSEDEQLFAPELPGGASCVYTQRVLQIASIVRSLSFHEENVQYLAKNTTLIRFLLLCANCWVGSLRQSGLDALGNISTELIIKDPATCLISRHILSTIQSALVSNDRARVLAALELLNKLAQNEANEDTLLKVLEAKVYSDVCALLTLRDIMVLVCTLECVYALTSLGDRAGEYVARLPGLVATLVSLVTVEAQSYGPRACILMRVVETVSGPSAIAAAAEREQDKNTQQQPLSQQQQPQPAPKPAAEPAPAPSPTPPAAPVNNVQHSHMQQRTVQENEHFAQAWLRSSYEALPVGDNSACDAHELHRHYMACCSKLGRKGVIAPANLSRLVRTVFGGTVGPNTITLASGETQQVYVGIRAKNQQNRVNPPAGPASPILKAQLTNKTPTVEVKTVVSQAQPQQAQPPHPHLSHALESNATNTTLIKHLLANKVAQRQQNQQRVITPSASGVVVQSNQSVMDVDPEALIKCTTITSGGVASSTPTIQGDKIVLKTEETGLKEEPIQIQMDEQTQLTIKTAQNKMLADLLEKKSNPPVQVVQMGAQMNAPTIQITETGQIVQVKPDTNPCIQFNEGIVTQGGQYFQIKNEQGQLIQIKNEQGQIIQLKTDQMQNPLIQFKDQNQVLQAGPLMQSVIQQQHVKAEKEEEQLYSEPAAKRMKVEEKRENPPQESVSKTAANLYAALAASALEDEDDLHRHRGIILTGALRTKVPPKQESVDVIQQPMIVGTSNDNASVIIQEPILQVQQPTMQVQQPTLQVQQPTIQMQAQTLQMQQPTLQVQQPMLQVQPMDVQNILTSQSGQLILQEKTMTSSPAQFVQQPMQIIATPGTSQGLSYITQNIPGNMMQKTIIIVQGPTGGGPLTLTVNNPGGLDEATLNSLITQATEAITQQQIIQNSGVIQSTQRVIVSQPTLVSTSQPITVVKTALAQNVPQLTASQQPIITTQPQPHKAQIVNQPMVVTQKQPPALISTSNSSQIVSGPQIIQGNQQIIAVSSNQQILMNTPIKQGVHRVVQQQRPQVNQTMTSNQTAQDDSKTSVIKSNVVNVQKPAQQPQMRQVITRQPVMVGNTKIGDREMVVNQPVTPEKPQTPAAPKPSATPPPPVQGTSQPQTAQDDTPWICHWRGCGKTFQNASEVFAHAAHAHATGGASGETPCLWLDCDRVPRRTFALLNHLTDKHCSPQALKALFNSRRHAAAESEASKPVVLGYPPNAALAALNKHAADMFNPRELMHRAVSRTPEQLDENEGPVTKSIRLTAALILRNIVIYSNTGRRQLRSYEAHLATIALSSVEASRTIAQVLYDMNNI
ncbi:brahma associated protein 170kD isoform X4 [Choristoneura fumiferana]|uniref:brahma associated protein 170kD isoform X4 n=1 Tax=Choristoneura fumiferana TaxID=7141 RepID=UPI003D15BBCB